MRHLDALLGSTEALLRAVDSDDDVAMSTALGLTPQWVVAPWRTAAATMPRVIRYGLTVASSGHSSAPSKSGLRLGSSSNTAARSR